MIKGTDHGTLLNKTLREKKPPAITNANAHALPPRRPRSPPLLKPPLTTLCLCRQNSVAAPPGRPCLASAVSLREAPLGRRDSPPTPATFLAAKTPAAHTTGTTQGPPPLTYSLREHHGLERRLPQQVDTHDLGNSEILLFVDASPRAGLGTVNGVGN